ncbi:hypothetical protein OF83DRAFT_1178358 [Amylostereum chailletii]|nr:hypothetical protein OF83DRAFT_1178358 [Amylostereum chailletii]
MSHARMMTTTFTNTVCVPSLPSRPPSHIPSPRTEALKGARTRPEAHAGRGQTRILDDTVRPARPHRSGLPSPAYIHHDGEEDVLCTTSARVDARAWGRRRRQREGDPGWQRAHAPEAIHASERARPSLASYRTGGGGMGAYTTRSGEDASVVQVLTPNRRNQTDVSSRPRQGTASPRFLVLSSTRAPRAPAGRGRPRYHVGWEVREHVVRVPGTSARRLGCGLACKPSSRRGRVGARGTQSTGEDMSVVQALAPNSRRRNGHTFKATGAVAGVSPRLLASSSSRAPRTKPTLSRWIDAVDAQGRVMHVLARKTRTRAGHRLTKRGGEQTLCTASTRLRACAVEQLRGFEAAGESRQRHVERAPGGHAMGCVTGALWRDAAASVSIGLVQAHEHDREGKQGAARTSHTAIVFVLTSQRTLQSGKLAQEPE